MVGPKGHPCQVGNDEPDKADESGKGNHEADQQGNEHQARLLRFFNVYAKLEGDLFTGGDEVELFGKAEENEGSSDQRRSQNDERSIAALRKISIKPEKHGVEATVRHDGDEKHNHRREKGIQNHPREQNGR